MMFAMGRQITTVRCVSEVCDFYYGLITKDTTPEQRENLDRILRGEQEGVATSAEVAALDAFEEMLSEMRASKDTDG